MVDELGDPLLERIESRILFTRGQKVMLATDLAVADTGRGCGFGVTIRDLKL